MTFESDIEKMLNFYQETERQFINLSYIIPLENDMKTHSPRLYNILQSSCGQIESMMRLICEKLNIQLNNHPKFPDYYTLINVNGVIARQQVFVIKLNKIVTPFTITSPNIVPQWWHNYNTTKHDLPNGLVEGNIGNTLDALSALYSLHSMAYYVTYATPSEFLRSTNWYEDTVDPNRTPSFIRLTLDNRPKSKIFYCMSKYSEMGARI